MTETALGRGLLFDATAVHVRDQLLEGEKEDFGLSKRGVEFDGHAQFVAVLHRIQSRQVRENESAIKFGGKEERETREDVTFKISSNSTRYRRMTSRWDSSTASATNNTIPFV